MNWTLYDGKQYQQERGCFRWQFQVFLLKMTSLVRSIALARNELDSVCLPAYNRKIVHVSTHATRALAVLPVSKIMWQF